MERNQNINYPSYSWPPHVSWVETLVEDKPPLYFDPYSIFETKIEDLERRVERLEQKVERLEQKVEQEIFPIEFLESEKLALRQPITVRASYSSKNNTWVVDHFELNIYGEGRDIDKAVKDFKIALEEVYFDLKEDKDKLSPQLQKEWELLRKLINEK